MPLKPRVYISGPISLGDRNSNFFQAVAAQKRLMLAGYAPLNPMLSLLAPFAWEKDFSHDVWVGADLPWVEVADVVWRLNGESVGADLEVEHAEEYGIPVVYTFEELEAWRYGVFTRGVA